MTAWIQPAIVACIVAASTWMAFVKLAPRPALRLRVRIAKAFGMNVPQVSAAKGCATGCSSCDSCGSSSGDTHKIVIHPRGSHHRG